ncbi:MAG: NAD(P)H-dependent oxidoreductase [Candidatus Aenigmatarchaeota archaeon]
MKNIIEDLNWRYATKIFDPKKKVSQADMNELLEALRLSASSFGIQPWKFVVVTDKKLREDLRKNAWDQPQITDASHLIVLCARTNVDENYVKKYAEDIAQTRKVPIESIRGYADMMIGSIKRKDKEEILEWSMRQVYITLGTLLTACAVKRIDACPMEGFDNAAYNRILKLDEEGVSSVVLCPVGYRGDDKYASAKKVRFPLDELIIRR